MTEQLTLSLHFPGSDSDSHLSWPSTPLLGKFSCLPGIVPTPALATPMSQSPAQTHWAPSTQRTAALSDSMDPTEFFLTVPNSSTPHAACPSRKSCPCLGHGGDFFLLYSLLLITKSPIHHILLCFSSSPASFMEATLLLLFSHSVVSNSLQPHGLQHTRLLCPPPSPRVCSNSCPLSWWCLLWLLNPNIYIFKTLTNFCVPPFIFEQILEDI